MHCFFYCLDFYITTAPKIIAISSITGCLHGKINSTIFTYHALSYPMFFCLDFYITTAPKIFAISSHTDKNSCRNFARLSACCSGFAFRNYSLSIIHYSLKKHASKRAFYCCDVFYFSSNFALSFAKYSVI